MQAGISSVPTISQNFVFSMVLFIVINFFHVLMVTQLWSHASLGWYNLYKQYFQSIIKLTKT